MRSLFVLPILALPLAAALAADGILEISQACASGPGCFADDTAGFPVQITAVGSYRLTGDLVVPNANTTAITITAGLVTLDLGGHLIRRPGCFPGACPVVLGSGTGVLGTGPGGTIVRNGQVWAMGADGLSLSSLCTVEGVGAHSNGNEGIRGSDGCLISKSTASSNGGFGIGAASGAVTFLDNVSQGNGIGIFAGVGSTIRGNTVSGNSGDGIRASFGNTVVDNTAFQNGEDGIDGGVGSTVTGNTAFSNGDTTASATDDGIECDFGCLVKGNTVRSNRGVGLRLGTDSGYRENVVTANTTGGVVGGVNLLDNYCAGTGVVSAACP